MDPSLQPTLPPGTLLGKYELVRLLGIGGMGAVYEARQSDLKRRVALKTLHPALAQQPDVLTRFLREGEAAARIDHPNIVSIYDVGTEKQTAYLVMEFLEGESLSGLLAREHTLTIDRSVDLLLPVVSALAAAHEVGVIHRDLKPDNIFLANTRRGPETKVLDFGISKILQADSQEKPLTATSAFMGTPYYMSPEQARGAKRIDARSDQFSFGVVLYECLTGALPFKGNSTFELLLSVVNCEFTPPRKLDPSIDPAFEKVLLRVMAREPSERFASMQELGRALWPFAGDNARAVWAPSFGSSEPPALRPAYREPVGSFHPTAVSAVQNNPPHTPPPALTATATPSAPLVAGLLALLVGSFGIVSYALRSRAQPTTFTTPDAGAVTVVPSTSPTMQPIVSAAPDAEVVVPSTVVVPSVTQPRVVGRTHHTVRATNNAPPTPQQTPPQTAPSTHEWGTVQ